MKTWHIVAIGGVFLVVVVLMMRAVAKPKAATANSSFPLPQTAVNGLAAGIGGFLAGLAAKQSGASSMNGPINSVSSSGGISSYETWDSTTGTVQDKLVMPLDRDYA